MKWNVSLVTVIFLIFACHKPVYSITHKETQENWFLTIGSGVQFSDLPSGMKVVNSNEATPPYNTDFYSINNDNSAVLTIFGGKRWQNRELWISSYSLGISWQYVFNNKINGQISQYSLPDMTNYNYSFNVNPNILLASGKINLLQYQRFSPYIQGGIGVAFINISNYKEKEFPGIIPRMSPDFGNTSLSNFAFNIGAGIDLPLNSQWIFSAGYLYQDIGSIHSNPGQGTWSNDALKIGSFHSNEILATLTYVFL